MSAEKSASLRFSIANNALHAILAGGFVAAGMYIALRFADSRDLHDLNPHARQSALWDLLLTNHGKTGVFLGLAGAAMFAWWMTRAVWRFLAEREAVLYADGRIGFHASYGRGPSDSIEDLERIELGREASPRLFGLIPGIDTLFFTFKAAKGPFHRRVVKVRSNTIEGGRQELERLESAVKSGLEEA